MPLSKLEGKSYFRLQLTCTKVHYSIRKDSNFSLNLNDLGYFEVTYDEYHRRIALLLKLRDGRSRPYEELIIEQTLESVVNWIHPYGVYGTRLQKLKLSRECDYTHVYITLKKYRLSFEVVDLEESRWTKEETLAFLQLVKPRRIFLDSEESNRYEALLNIKSIETAIVQIMPPALATAAPSILSKFPEVKIIVQCNSVKYELLRIMLRILCAEPFPNLYKFNFSTFEETGMVDDPIEREDDYEFNFALAEFNVMRRDSTFDEISAIVEVPDHFPAGTTCEWEMVQIGRV